MIKYLFALFLLLMPMPMYAYLTDNNTYQVPSISRPALLIPVTDTVFGTTVTRITDPTMIANDATYPRQGLRHEYARLASLNSDNTKAVVLALGGAERGNYYVIDIRNGARLRTIPRDGLDPTAMWHPTNPDMLIYRISNEIRTMNVSNGNITTLMKFPQYEYVTTREEGTVSDDWRYFAFLGYKPGANWAMADFVVADLQAKTIIGLIVNQTDIPDWIGMSASGQYVVIGFVTTSTKLYSRNLAYLRDLFPYVSHGDFAIDQNGDDVLIYFAQTSGQIAEFNNQPVLGVVRLRDGQKWAAINTYWKWGGHISGIASRKHPGWVLVSTYQNINSSQDWPFQREVFWLSINGSKEVKRIAHHHSDMGWDPSGEKDYFSEPHAVPSWDGNVATFASVWGSPFTQYDFYTVTGNFWNESSQPPPQDTTPPLRSNGQPTGTLAAGTTSATISLTTNEPATCRYSTTSGVSYNSMITIFTTTGGTSHSSTVTGLTNGNTYNYYVRCSDAAGNANTDDLPISFSVASLGQQTCTDGTPINTCSTTKPKFCNSAAILLDSCSTCGCPTNQQCNATTQACYTPQQACSDGTAINVCSATKPKYCDANRNLVDKCTACGCATGYTCNSVSQSCVQSTTSNVTVYNKLTFTGKIIKNNRNKTPCSFCTLTIGLLGVSNTTTTSSTGSFTLDLYVTITPGTYTLSITINDGTRTYNFYKRIKIDSTAEKLGLKT